MLKNVSNAIFFIGLGIVAVTSYFSGLIDTPCAIGLLLIFAAYGARIGMDYLEEAE